MYLNNTDRWKAARKYRYFFDIRYPMKISIKTDVKSKLRREWENLCKPEESEHKTKTTDHDTNFEHILSLDKTS